MGNGQAKRDLGLDKVELAFVTKSFKLISNGRDHIVAEDLSKAWSKFPNLDLIRHLNLLCFGRSKSICFAEYARFYYVVIKGNVTDKANYIITNMSLSEHCNSNAVDCVFIYGLASSVINSYFMILHQCCTNYKSWYDQNIYTDAFDAKLFAEFILRDVVNEHHLMTLSQLERWFYREWLFMQIWREVMIYLYGHAHKYRIPPPMKVVSKTLPICTIPDRYGSLTYDLTIPRVMFITDCLPEPCRRFWTPLFNSKVHGESFTTLIAKIIHKGPTIILIKDENDFVFGGFASMSWAVSPKFSGDPLSVLFTVHPKMERYISSGRNDHYQYLNTGQHTMPNGLGMGGQFNYWGLWLDSEFRTGQSSETCSTFIGYSQLSSNKTFTVRHLEVWAVSDPRQSIGYMDGIHNTILNERAADKFIMELGGHVFHSDGLRQSFSRRRSTRK